MHLDYYLNIYDCFIFSWQVKMNMTFATVDRDGREIIDAQEFIKGTFSSQVHKLSHYSRIYSISCSLVYKLFFSPFSNSLPGLHGATLLDICNSSKEVLNLLIK